MKRGDNLHTSRTVDELGEPKFIKRQVTEFASFTELKGNPTKGQPGYYDLADDVTDEQFEGVIEEAKTEQNLSRANVVRKIKGETKPKQERHEMLHGTRRIDPNRIVRETVISLEGLAVGLSLLDGRYGELDPDEIEGWVTSLRSSLQSVNRLVREMTRDHQR
jgi:hypothetical protein